MPPPIAVTAASGRLGHAILREFVRRGLAADVRAVARDPTRVRVPEIDTRAGDYQSVAAMTAALEGIDTGILISAPVAGGSDRVVLHRNVIRAAEAAGVRRLIFTSVIGNGGEERTWFGPTQAVNRQTEADLAESRLQWVVGRNALYLELDLIQMRNAAARDGVYTNPGADGRCAYLTIDELAFAYAELATGPDHAGQTYNLSGECLTQAELVALAASVFGFELRYRSITDEQSLEKFRTLMPERGEAVARMLTGAFQCIRSGAYDVPSHYRQAAGRDPKPVRQMFEELAARGVTPAASKV
jgi:NAD(P)H dehydrogenase (quinone)